MGKILILLLLVLPCYAGQKRAAKPPKKVSVKSVQITPSTALVLEGQNFQFKAVATYTNGSTRDVTTTCTWSSSSTSIAVVNSTGLATGMTSGGVNIISSLNGASDQAILTVTSQSHQVGLQWIASLGESMANVYRSMFSGGGYSKIGTTNITRFTDRNVVSGIDYFYVVTAVDISGNESGYSNEVGVTIP